MKKNDRLKEGNGGKEGGKLDSASLRIDARIEELKDWRGVTLARIRSLIKQAEREVVEEWKWRGVPVWSYAGIICTGETYKHTVKTTFARGASLEDPAGLFNSSLEGNTRRAIDFHEGDKIPEKAFKALVRAAVELNKSSKASTHPVRPRQTATEFPLAPPTSTGGQAPRRPHADIGPDLAAAQPHWDQFLQWVGANLPDAEIVWKDYAGKTGRQCVIRMKDRNLAYLKPAAGSFLASVALSDAAVADLDDSKLPEALIHEIRSSPKYPEGRPARVCVDSIPTLKMATALMEIKIADRLRAKSKRR